MKAKYVYLVETGHGAAGPEGIRFVTFDHEKAIAFAKKFVKQLNRKRKRERFPRPAVKMELLTGNEGVFGEKVAACWSNGYSRDVEIIEYAIDKEYNPVWLR